MYQYPLSREHCEDTKWVSDVGATLHQANGKSIFGNKMRIVADTLCKITVINKDLLQEKASINTLSGMSCVMCKANQSC